MFTGSIGDLNFYHTKNHGWLVRQKSSLSRKKFKEDPAFERARENGSNFGKASTSGKYLRHAFRPLWAGLQDSDVCARAVSLMHRIRQFDTVSNRGEFLTMTGLQNPEARQLLKGFSFNDGPSAGQVMLRQYSTDISAGTVSITGLIPGKELKAPGAATHVMFQSGFARFDFDKEYKRSSSPEHMLPLDGNAYDMLLQAEPVPAVENSIGVLVLKIVFYQQVNGQLFLLSNREHSVVEVVGAAFTDSGESTETDDAPDVSQGFSGATALPSGWFKGLDKGGYDVVSLPGKAPQRSSIVSCANEPPGFSAAVRFYTGLPAQYKT